MQVRTNPGKESVLWTNCSSNQLPSLGFNSTSWSQSRKSLISSTKRLVKYLQSIMLSSTFSLQLQHPSSLWTIIYWELFSIIYIVFKTVLIGLFVYVHIGDEISLYNSPYHCLPVYLYVGMCIWYIASLLVSLINQCVGGWDGKLLLFSSLSKIWTLPQKMFT